MVLIILSVGSVGLHETGSLPMYINQNLHETRLLEELYNPDNTFMLSMVSEAATAIH